jgi:hypothetical protein
MAHFAKVTNDNKVEREVIVIANDDCGGGELSRQASQSVKRL